MQREVFVQHELTVQKGNPTLNKEQSIFMGDAGIPTEGSQAGRAKAPDHSVPPRPINPDQLRGEWHSVFGPRDLQNSDTRSAIEAAVGLNLGPQKATSKERLKPQAEEVIANASLDSIDPATIRRSKELADKENPSDKELTELLEANSARLELLEVRWGKKLTNQQKVDFLRLHYYGLGDEGKDGKPASVYNLKEEQIAYRVRGLKELGYDKKQRREIMESGLAAPGDPGTPEYYQAQIAGIITRLTTPYLDSKLEEFRQALVAMHGTVPGGVGPASPGTSGRLTREWLENFTNGIYDYAKDKPITTIEGDSLQQAILAINRNFYLMDGGDKTEADFIRKYDNLAQDPANHSFLIDHVREYVSTLNPSANGIPEQILLKIIKANDDEALEHLAFRIVGIPLQSETGDYSVGFYGGINLDAVTNLLQTMSQNPLMETRQVDRDKRRDQLRNVNLIKEGVLRTHEINKFLMLNQPDNAFKMGESMLPEYMQILGKQKGIGIMTRFIESGFLETLSANGHISGGNYKEMMGNAQSSLTGRIIEGQPNSLYMEFRNFVNSLNEAGHEGLRVNDLQSLMGMEDWEIDLAFNLTRNIYNTQNRSAEIASMGIVPEGDDAYASAFQEGMMKVYNPGEWTMKRFKIAEQRGGVRWFERLTDSIQRRRGIEGYGKMMLEKIKGHEIKFFELPTMAGMRGYWSSWKANGGLLKNLDVNYQPTGETVNYDVLYGRTRKIIYNTKSPDRVGIGYLLNTGAIRFKNASGDKSWKEASDAMHADFFRSIFLKPGTGVGSIPAELRSDLQMGLGIIYKIALTPDGGHKASENKELNKVKEQVRTLIWERVAKDNPLAIVPYLHGLEYKAGHNGGGTVLTDIYERPAWLGLHRKLNIWNEIKLDHNSGKKGEDGKYLAGHDPLPDFSLNDAILFTDAKTSGSANRINITTEERAILDEIIREGVLASPDMANVRYAFIPFGNDYKYERTNYDDPGPESFKRHYGDVAKIFASTSVLPEMMDNLGKIVKYEQMVEFIDKLAKGITDVHGVGTAWAKAAPVIDATIGFFRRGENTTDIEEPFVGEDELPRIKRIARWIKQQDELNVIADSLHKPQSEAQMFYNSKKLLALDRQQVNNAMEELKGHGLMGMDEEKYLRKRFGGLLGFLLRVFMENALRFTKLGVAGGGWSLFGKSFEAKGAVE